LGTLVPIDNTGFRVTVAVGDGLDYESQFRNDGVSLLEAGYMSGGTFVALGSLTVQPWETPNGMWKDFSFSFATTPASMGQPLIIQITHTVNADLNQARGSYDHIRVGYDTDVDGIPDCIDFDSDDDGCPDVKEQFGDDADEDNDGQFGVFPAIVNDRGLVNLYCGYYFFWNANIRMEC